MISASQTNYLYLADSLPKKYLDFYNRFTKVLSECEISFSLLPHTKDIWAVDYMPIQIGDEDFIQFVYNPDYLQSKTWLQSISDVDGICKAIDLEPEKSKIKLDGGNVVTTNTAVIMSNKVFKENLSFKQKDLINALKSLFKVENLFFVPVDPTDTIGHADGMVRFIDDKTVLINKYSEVDIDIQLNLKMALHNAGLDWIEIPYNPYHNKNNIQANGMYINFLQMEKVVIIPTFNIKDDEIAVKLFEEIFTHHEIRTIDSNDIANQGGVLNCITWNIKK